MAQNVGKDDSQQLENHNSSLSAAGTPGDRSIHPSTGKPALDWEQPDFDELDLCMEVTTYIQNWQ